MEITVMKPTTVKVEKIKARCGVRYWEDGTVNGVEDTEGDLIPLRQGDDWCPTIDVETGRIEGWPGGTTASVHYKVCDDGRYALVGEDGAGVVSSRRLPVVRLRSAIRCRDCRAHGRGGPGDGTGRASREPRRNGDPHDGALDCGASFHP